MNGEEPKITFDLDPTHLGLRLDRRIVQTAKTALNLAISLS